MYLQNSISAPLITSPDGQELNTVPTNLDAAEDYRYAAEEVAISALAAYEACSDADDALTVAPAVFDAASTELRRSLVELGRVYKGMGVNFLGAIDYAGEAFGTPLPAHVEMSINEGYSNPGAVVWENASYARDALAADHRPARTDDFDDHLADCAAMRARMEAAAPTTESIDPMNRLADPFSDLGDLEIRAKLKAQDMWVAQRAREILTAATSEPPTPIDDLGSTLCDLLDEDDEEEVWRIRGLLPAAGNVVLAAQRKAGKSTMVGNLIRSLVDGDEFLPGPTPFMSDGFTVTPLAEGEKVVLLDFELSKGLVKRWLRDQGIKNTHMVEVKILRGRASQFDVNDPKRRAEWVAWLRSHNAKVLIIDPLAPILGAYGIEENSTDGINKLLASFDALKAEAGIDELFIAHHMGHNGERSRGSSRLRDWPDAEWMIVRENAQGGKEPPPDAKRFFMAEGRDVMVPEFALDFDPTHRRLLKGGGNRTQHTRTKNTPVAAEVVGTNPGMGRNELVELLRAEPYGLSQQAAKDAITAAVDLGAIHRHEGARRTQHHYPGPCGDGCTGLGVG